MSFEYINRAEIDAKETQVPLVRIEVIERNSCVVLNDDVAMIENEIADRGETVFEQQIRRRLEKTRAGAKTLAKLQKTRSRLDAAVGNICGEIKQRLCIA